jgi:hypothetical protein
MAAGRSLGESLHSTASDSYDKFLAGSTHTPQPKETSFDKPSIFNNRLDISIYSIHLGNQLLNARCRKIFMNFTNF